MRLPALSTVFVDGRMKDERRSEGTQVKRREVWKKRKVVCGKVEVKRGNGQYSHALRQLNETWKQQAAGTCRMTRRERYEEGATCTRLSACTCSETEATSEEQASKSEEIYTQQLCKHQTNTHTKGVRTHSNWRPAIQIDAGQSSPSPNTRRQIR